MHDARRTRDAEDVAAAFARAYATWPRVTRSGNPGALALQAITPHPAPVDRAVRRGAVIRVRRRLTAVAGLAVVAAGAAVPVLPHQQAAQPALSRARHQPVRSEPGRPEAQSGAAGPWPQMSWSMAGMA